MIIMYEAYRIGVKLSLINHISSGLSVIGKDFTKVHKQTTELQNQLKNIKLMGMAGAGIGAFGFMGLGIIGKALKPAEEYAHQLNIMNMAGLKQVEIAEAIELAWKNTRTVMTTTPASNLRDILDLRNVLGDLDKAKIALPKFTQIQAIMESSAEEGVRSQAKGFAFSMAKALDMIGHVKDISDFIDSSERMQKVITAFQGRVTPEMFRGIFQYARQSKLRLSKEYMFEIMPTLALERSIGTGAGSGGGSRGIGPAHAAMYRITNQGYVNKNVIPELKSLGLYVGKAGQSSTNSTTLLGSFKDSELAAEHPFNWINNVVVPAIYKKYGKITDAKMLDHLNYIFKGNQQAADTFGEFFIKKDIFLRDQRIIQGAMKREDAISAAMSKDPVIAHKVLTQQWETLKTSFMMGVVPVLIPAMIKLGDNINYIANIVRKHKDIATGLVLLAGGLSIVMAFGGSILTFVAVAKGLGLIFAPLIAGLGAMVTGLVGVSAAVATIGVVATAFVSVVSGILINKAVNWLVNWFTNGKEKTLGGLLFEMKKAMTGESTVEGYNDRQYMKLWIKNHPEEARKRGLVPDGSVLPPRNFVPNTSKSTEIKIENNLHVDGNQLEIAVTRRQADKAERYNYGKSSPDYRQALMQPSH